MLSVFEWLVPVLQCDAFVVNVLSDESTQNQGRGLVYRILVNTHSNFVIGCPKAVLLFWIFCTQSKSASSSDFVES